jgi:hypothetical protein
VLGEAAIKPVGRAGLICALMLLVGMSGEARINANAFVGSAFDYSNPKANLFNNAGSIDANSYQLSVYGAWANAHFFA